MFNVNLEPLIQQIKEFNTNQIRTNQILTETKQELDQSLEARQQGIKVFGKEHDKRKKVEKELNETVEEASSEIIGADNKVSDLKTKLRMAQQTIQQLNNELK